jgi:hypothetical protein
MEGAHVCRPISHIEAHSARNVLAVTANLIFLPQIHVSNVLLSAKFDMESKFVCRHHQHNDDTCVFSFEPA